MLLLLAPLDPDVWSDGILRWWPRLDEVLLAGSVRRAVATLGALLLMVAAHDLAAALGRLRQRP